jgi:hypothetical protein
MTLPTLERSTYDATPYELYEFLRGSTVWRWTNVEREQLFLGRLFTPTQISRSSVKDGEERSARNLTIYVPRDNPLAVSLIEGSLAREIRVNLYSAHRTISEVDTPWQGQVSGIAVAGSQAEILCTGINSFLDKPAPRLPVQRNCPLMLYEPRCGVDKLGFSYPAVVIALDGANIHVQATDLSSTGLTAPLDVTDDHFEGGYVELGDHTAFVTEQGWDSAPGTGPFGILTLMNRIPVAVGSAVTIVEGCKRTVDWCRVRFGNLPNHFGFPFLPLRNPFDRLA